MFSGRRRLAASLIAALAFWGAPVLAEDNAPLSAIDWLSESFDASTARRLPDAPSKKLPAEPPVAQSGAAPAITVQLLGASSPDPVGLLPPSVTGLPQSLWAQSSEDVLLSDLRALEAPSLPALQELLVQLMLAEARPPLNADPKGPLFLARVDKLLDLGALDQAQALVEAADLNQPQVFTRWFDISLLTGTEDFACEKMMRLPALAPAVPTRVFCLARGGDWMAAALVLKTSRSLGRISPEDDQLLTLFLDPEMADESETFGGESLLPPPSRMSPLVFRLYEAIGEPVPTATLPRAFAHADLRSLVAWRNQLESVERLARAGALSENILIGTYTANTPAASGGIWDRARAIQAFDKAISSGNLTRVSETLPQAWTAATEARVEVPFARFYSDALRKLTITGAAERIAITAGLLSEAYEETARKIKAPSIGDAFLIAIATGQVTQDTPLAGWEDAPMAEAIFKGLTLPTRDGSLADTLNAGKIGEGLLKALQLIGDGTDGDSTALTNGLLALRQMGLEGLVRRSALELLLLERPL